MREGWLDASVLAFAYVGTEAGAQAAVPALRSVRATLRAARLVLLWPEVLAVPAPLARLADGCIAYPSPGGETGRAARARRAGAARAVAELRKAEPAGLVVLTESGHSPYYPAYLACLAGVARRAGLSREFGGAVLTNALAPPPDEVSESERHLFLVDALGFGRRVETLPVAAERARPVHRPAPPPARGAETTRAES